MRGFRLSRAKYAGFSGRGSLFASGRWHWAGVPMIYCADSRALAVLETLVHARKDQIPSDYVFYRIDLDNSLIELVRGDALPEDWTAEQPKLARDLGSEWMRSRRSLALTVPSVVVPDERNLLLNPEHPAFPSARISAPYPFQVDRRLFR